MKTQKITKAVIAIAGYGTRFLPATKVQPKEMLPIIDKPVIQYIVEELIDSGIKDIIMVTRGQYTLESHFDNNIDLEVFLEKNNKTEILKELIQLPKKANYIYVRQKKHLPYGNGTPLLAAKNLIKDEENFVYVFGDDLVKSKTPATSQLIDYSYKNPSKIIIATQNVAKSEVSKYGIVKLGKDNKTVQNIIEKPKIEEAPTTLAVLGRFILNKDVIAELSKKKIGKDGELWLMDAISTFVKQNKVISLNIDGLWLTTGDPLNFIITTLEYAKDRKDLWEGIKKYINSI